MRKILIFIVLMNLYACDYLPKKASLTLNEQQVTALNTQLQDASDVVANALKTHQFVALGDAHYYDGFMNAITQIVTSERVVAQKPTIIVEFGNEINQEYLSKYVLGRTSDTNQLKKVLRDTVYFTAWLGNGYLEFFQALRAINLTLDEDDKINVVLAEKAFDWQLATEQSWQQNATTKVDGFFEKVEPLIHADTKAILIFGGFHLLKSTNAKEVSPADLTLISRIEKEKPGSVYTVWPMIQAVIFEKFATHQDAKIIETANSVLEDVVFADVMPKARVMLSKQASRDSTLSELADALLYIGHSERNLNFSPETLKDKAWIAEMKRRVALIGGRLEQRFNTLLSENDV